MDRDVVGVERTDEHLEDLRVLGKPFTPYLRFLPLVILVQFVFTLGFSFLVSALTVHFRDIKDILTNLITLWFFSTPIIYPLSLPVIQENPLVRVLVQLNPMTHVMWGYQNSVFYGELIR